MSHVSELSIGCDKIPEKSNFKKEIFTLAHSIRGFSPKLADSIAMVRQNTMTIGTCDRSHCSSHGGWKTEREGDQRQGIPSNVMPSDPLPPMRPTS
jgi:hypothetical protein